MLNKQSIATTAFGHLVMLLVCMVLPSGLQAAIVAVCDEQPVAASAVLVRETRGADDRTRYLVVTDSANGLDNCATSFTEGSAANAGWIGTARDVSAADAPVSLTLVGQFDSAPWQVSEINVPPGETDVTTVPQLVLPIPYAENLLTYFDARIFGREERATWLTEEGALLCRAGDEPAGLVFEVRRPWPGDPAMELELQYSGAGSINVAIADSTVASLDNPELLGTISPANQSRISRLLLPRHEEDWQALVFLCPQQQAELTLTGLRLMPPQVPVKATRAAWFWEPAAWQDRQSELAGLAQDYRLNRLYVTVPVNTQNDVAEPQALARFIKELRAENIEVWAVAGDPRDVIESSHPALRARMQAFADYNKSVAENARLAGVQLDIEPYLLPGFSVGDVAWQQRYRDTIEAAAEILQNQLQLSIVVPVWWGSNPLWGEPLLDQLKDKLSGITVMNYRTSSEALRIGSLPFLDWSQRSDVPLELAVETGSVGPDQTRLNFARAGQGELLLLRTGNTDIMVLVAQAVSAGNAVTYQQVASSVAAASNISFLGDMQKLEAVLDIVVPEWSAWDAFSSIAIHGLEEHFMAP